MVTKWSDIKHKSSPERQEEIRQEALIELKRLKDEGLLDDAHDFPTDDSVGAK